MSEAMNFVVENMDLIRKHVRNAARASRLDSDDLLSEVVMVIGTTHHKYDATMGTATTWIYWQVRRAAQQLYRNERQTKREVRVDSYDALPYCHRDRNTLSGSTRSIVHDVHDNDVTNRGNSYFGELQMRGVVVGEVQRIQAGIDARRVLARATNDEAAAVVSSLEGWTMAEVRDQLGIGAAGRNQRIYRMRERMGLSAEGAMA